MTTTTQSSLISELLAQINSVNLSQPQLKQAINLQARKELCKTNYYEFFKEFWETVVSEPLVINNHIKVICDELQKVGESLFKREYCGFDYLMINVPPGTSKSTITSILWPVWLWVNDPRLRVISSSYSFDASEPHSTKSKDCIKSDKFQQWYGNLFNIRRDQDNKSVYATDKMGARITTSSGGTITGKHANLIIVDDPHKPPDPEKEQAGASPAELLSDVRWHYTSLESRKVNETIVPIVIVMQRLSENDLCGDLLKKSKSGEIKLRHIKLPATTDFQVIPPELESIYTDGILDPKRKGKEVLAKKRVTLGTYGFAGQYGQDPAPPEGGIIKKHWFGRFRRAELPDNLTVSFYIDTAYTEDKKNDPSGIIAFTEHNGNLYILGVSIVYKDFPNLCPHIVEYAKSMGYTDQSMIYIEPKASGISIYQMLKLQTGLNYALDKFPGGMTDKVMRVNAQTPRIEAGRVLLLDGAHWVESFIDECAMFPNAAHDECVDILTGAMRKGLKSGIDYTGFR